jgi:phosphatidylglycerol:prolipoprotein diacylglycerol transferase
MRQVLFRIPWDGIPFGDFRLPIFGWGVLLLVWIGFCAWTLWEIRRQTGSWQLPDVLSLAFWIGLAVVLIKAPDFGRQFAPEGAPLYGYGAMLVVGFASALWLAGVRARRAGFPAETIGDLAVWLFVAGIIGARAFYLIQYHEHAFAGARTLPQILFAAVNLSSGGLVFYGSAIGGAVGHFAFCHVRKLSSLNLADVITPSVFIGVGFGRIGCLLNGCCFGDACDLPWSIVFPAESVPWLALVQRGFLAPDALQSPPLHPSQIYSAIDGFLIAGLTLWYSRYRRCPGDVLALGLLMSSVTRFLIEFVRGDEYGQWGTALTISQWIAVGLFATGIGLQVYLTCSRTTTATSQG